jgi:hypothetical protein
MEMSFDPELSSNAHPAILNDVGGWFVSKQWDGVTDGNRGHTALRAIPGRVSGFRNWFVGTGRSIAV